MISRLTISKLFGRFDYDILFKKDILTILTGPNGYGKSTILKIIEAFNKFNINYFSTISFEQITIYVKNEKESFTIIKVDNGVKINGSLFQKNMMFKRKFGNPVTYDNYYLSNRRFEKLLSIDYKLNLDKEVSFKDTKINDISWDLIWELENSKSGTKSKTKRSLLDTMSKIKASVEQVYFIKEQRLIREEIEESKREFVNVIEELPNKFKILMGNLSDNYSKKANQLDSTYPSRLFNTEKGINENEYIEKMSEMSRKFEKLKKYDISDMTVFSNFVFKEEHSKALKVYFDDFNEKYKVYEKYILMFDLYTRIINERLSFKKIKISRDIGLSIYDIDDEENHLNLNELSSGEKQEIVLFFELIFDTPNNILLLIDEPEISLHISWQKMFINDLLKIAEYKNLNIIVATHSPQIISNHWDRQIDLGELYGN